MNLSLMYKLKIIRCFLTLHFLYKYFSFFCITMKKKAFVIYFLMFWCYLRKCFLIIFFLGPFVITYNLQYLIKISGTFKLHKYKQKKCVWKTVQYVIQKKLEHVLHQNISDVSMLNRLLSFVVHGKAHAQITKLNKKLHKVLCTKLVANGLYFNSIEIG